VGTKGITIHNSMEEPYHTLFIKDTVEFTSYPIQQLTQPSLPTSETFSMWVFTNQVPQSMPLFYQHLHVGDLPFISIRWKDPNHQQPIWTHKNRFLFFYHTEPFLYWECNGNCICQPTNNQIQFSTLPQCQIQCYSQNRDKQSFLGHSSNLIYRILDNYNQQTPPSENILLASKTKKTMQDRSL